MREREGDLDGSLFLFFILSETNAIVYGRQLQVQGEHHARNVRVLRLTSVHYLGFVKAMACSLQITV